MVGQEQYLAAVAQAAAASQGTAAAAILPGQGPAGPLSVLPLQYQYNGIPMYNPFAAAAAMIQQNGGQPLPPQTPNPANGTNGTPNTPSNPATPVVNGTRRPGSPSPASRAATPGAPEMNGGGGGSITPSSAGPYQMFPTFIDPNGILIRPNGTQGVPPGVRLLAPPNGGHLLINNGPNLAAALGNTAAAANSNPAAASPAPGTPGFNPLTGLGYAGNPNLASLTSPSVSGDYDFHL